MRGHSEPRHVLHLEVDIRIDQVVREHPAGFEELAVLVQRPQHASLRSWYLGFLSAYNYKELVCLSPHNQTAKTGLL